MPNAMQYKTEDRIFALFVGRSGSGKSVAAASFDRPLVDLDMDFRFAGIKAAIDQGIISGDEVSYEQFAPRSGWTPIEKYLMNLDFLRVQGAFPLKTIIIDSVTSLTRLLVVTSHAEQRGKSIGSLRVSGPGDYAFEASATHQVFDYLRSFKCNIIATAHIIDKYGKIDPSKEYSESGVVGEKLSIRENLGENIQTYFDNVFRFSRDVVSGQVKYYVEFATDLAKNAYAIPPGKFDITGKNFSVFFKELIKNPSALKPERNVAAPTQPPTPISVLPPPKRI